MNRYIRVAWPESQEWMDDKYDGQVIQASDEHNIYTFVPEELYKKVHSRRLPRLTRRRRPTLDGMDMSSTEGLDGLPRLVAGAIRTLHLSLPRSMS